MGRKLKGRRTLSRISTRFSASVGLMLSGDRSSRNVVETMKEIDCALIPSPVRSSGAIEGKSGEGFSSSADHVPNDSDWDSL